MLKAKTLFPLTPRRRGAGPGGAAFPPQGMRTILWQSCVIHGCLNVKAARCMSTQLVEPLTRSMDPVFASTLQLSRLFASQTVRGRSDSAAARGPFILYKPELSTLPLCVQQNGGTFHIKTVTHRQSFEERKHKGVLAL